MSLNGLLHCICLQTPGLTFPTRAFIKTAAPKDQHARENLKRECERYLLPSVSSGACFRKMYDVIINPMNIGNSDDGSITYVAFEWLETTLADVKYQPDMHNYAIIKTIVKIALTSCIILADRQLVNTGRTPDLEGLASANQLRLQARKYLALLH